MVINLEPIVQKVEFSESNGSNARKERLESEKNKSAILNVINCHQEEPMDPSLDVRDMVTSPNDKYLITCSETKQGESPKVCVWPLENILQGMKNAKGEIIEAQEDHEFQKISNRINWLLSVDAIELEELQKWVICAGSLNGDLYLWSGDIERKTKEWILNPPPSRNLTRDNGIQKAITKVKIVKESDKKIQIFVILKEVQGKKLAEDNNYVLAKYCIDFDVEGNIKNLVPETLSSCLEGESENEGQKKDCILVCDFTEDNKFLVGGSRNNTIIKWNLKSKDDPIICEVGTHEDSVTSIKLFKAKINEENDKKEKIKNKNDQPINKNKEKYKLASGSSDGVIKIWDLEENSSFDLGKHQKEIVSLDLLIGEKFLVSASKDNTIKLWDLNNHVLVRNIILDKELEMINGQEKQIEMGLNFLRKIILTKNNQYILALRKNRIFIIRNYGRIWHFYRQLKYIKDDAKDLYERIYGENLRQIAKWEKENEETLKELFILIKTRLSSNISTKSLDNSPNNEYDLWELGKLFIPSFIRFEETDNQQKQYIKGVQANYDNYWYSANKMFVELLHFSWGFKFFLTTSIEEEMTEAKYIELREENRTILKKRNQSQIRFKMVLDNIPATFIPLLKAINIEIEDDRGDKDTLIFTDFIYSENDPIKLLKKPSKSSKKPIETRILKDSYYSDCTFKLDERYSKEKQAIVYIKKISLEFTESLDPLKSSNALPQDVNLFEAFRDNFRSPDVNKIKIKIGKGFWSAAGKIMDEYLARFIMLDFIFTFISILLLFEQGNISTIIGIITMSLNLTVSILIIVLIIYPLIKKLGKYFVKKVQER